jgi:hypothetical protein
MTPLTICLSYYENPGMLAHQLRNLAALPLAMRVALDLVVVDDGSPAAPAEQVFKAESAGIRSAELYRMREDIAWNQDACRNLAVSLARTEWVLLTDMDHVPTEALLRRAMSKPLDPSAAYTFRRVSAPDLTPYKPHPNSWLMTRALYDRVGGYDERYAGVYGTDGAFRRGVEKNASAVIEIKEALIRVPREVIADASTTTLARKSPDNDRAKAERAAQIKASGQLRPVRGLFAWDRVA